MKILNNILAGALAGIFIAAFVSAIVFIWFMIGEGKYFYSTLMIAVLGGIFGGLSYFIVDSEREKNK